MWIVKARAGKLYLLLKKEKDVSKALAKQEMFDDRTSSNIVLVIKHFTVWSPCLMVFVDVWSCLNSIKHFFCSHVCLVMFGLFGQVYQTCLARACKMHYCRFRQVEIVVVVWVILCNSLCSDVWRCLIKHVWTVWPGLQTSKCLITKQYFMMMFDRQTFPVWPDVNCKLFIVILQCLFSL